MFINIKSSRTLQNLWFYCSTHECSGYVVNRPLKHVEDWPGEPNPQTVQDFTKHTAGATKGPFPFSESDSESDVPIYLPNVNKYIGNSGI